ncbi:MAG: hypothetical protein LBJ14_05545 [Desulfarculales bacterium]|jgi:hypothetical protein|nr:hypothetical protein [Desulfarculales bacterium]
MGFNDWIEIFKGGRQVDAEGQEHNGDQLIAKAAAGYDPQKHQAPVVIGHPQSDAPAYAWVEGLRETNRDGVKVLEAKLAQVDDGFAQMVRDGRFKMRSAAFYPDGGLRHVGFLGAQPPAVKGLKAVNFSGEDKFSEFNFAERNEKVWIPGQARNDKEEKNANKEDAMSKNSNGQGEGASGQKTEEASAAELQKLRQEKDELARQFAELQTKTRRAEHQVYLEKLEADGVILPYQQPGLLNFMEALSGQEEKNILFREGEGKDEQKVNPLEFFKKHLEGQKRHGLFVASTRGQQGTETKAVSGYDDLLSKV